MTWKDKLAEANLLFEKARAVVENAAATAEEKNQVPKMLEGARALKADALQLKEIIDEAQSAVEFKNQSATAPVLNPGSFKGWGEYLEAVWAKTVHGVDDSRLTWFKEDKEEGTEKKSLSGATMASGEALIPVQFLPQLQAVQGEDTIVRGSGATVIRMTSRQLTLPVLDQTDTTAGVPHWFGGMKFYWEEEGGEKTETEAKFRRINLVAKKLIGYTNASDELLEDSAISLGDFLSGPLGFAGGIAWMEDYAFLRGVGGGQPRGIVNAPATLHPQRAVAGQINYVDVINMLENFLPSGRGQWVISHSAMANVIQMTGPAGNPSYVWQPSAREGVPGFLLGFPVRWTEKLPRIGQRGDILLMDPRYYVIGDRQATTIDSTKYHRWVYDETSWRAVHRVDGQPWLSLPITYSDGADQVSPFVVLDTVSGT